MGSQDKNNNANAGFSGKILVILLLLSLALLLEAMPLTTSPKRVSVSIEAGKVGAQNCSDETYGAEGHGTGSAPTKPEALEEAMRIAEAAAGDNCNADGEKVCPPPPECVPAARGVVVEGEGPINLIVSGCKPANGSPQDVADGWEKGDKWICKATVSLSCFQACKLEEISAGSGQ